MARTKEGKENKESQKVAEILQFAVGRRKRAVARVRMYAGSGDILINGKKLNEYLTTETQIKEFMMPLNLAGMTEGHYFTAKVIGGGPSGQMEAVRLGIAKCISKVNEDLKKAMRQNGLLTRDPREKERKKIYHVGARKSPQFSKR
jgi:small subunit ribosomal protein S9